MILGDIRSKYHQAWSGWGVTMRFGTKVDHHRKSKWRSKRGSIRSGDAKSPDWEDQEEAVEVMVCGGLRLGLTLTTPFTNPFYIPPPSHRRCRRPDRPLGPHGPGCLSLRSTRSLRKPAHYYLMSFLFLVCSLNLFQFEFKFSFNL
jgi:hypothetical protein